MKASEINNYLKSLNGGWVDEARTVDTFKAGNPDDEVKGIAVGWMSYIYALKRALELGCNMFITHEPTYYDHYDDISKNEQLEIVRNKKAFIEQNRIIILRCHDLWDKYPGEGISDSWGDMLGFGKPIAGEGYFHVYEVEGNTSGEIARKVAGILKHTGQNAVQLIGPDNKEVRTIAIGTGAATPFLHMVQTYNVDMTICSDDGFCYWRDGALAIDMDFPVLVVNHAVSELNGMKRLAQHLSRKYPEIPVHYIDQSCMYKLVE